MNSIANALTVIVGIPTAMGYALVNFIEFLWVVFAPKIEKGDYIEFKNTGKIGQVLDLGGAGYFNRVAIQWPPSADQDREIFLGLLARSLHHPRIIPGHTVDPGMITVSYRRMRVRKIDITKEANAARVAAWKLLS